MYLGITIENFITVGVMLLVWMLALHLIGQAGVSLPSWIGFGGS